MIYALPSGSQCSDFLSTWMVFNGMTAEHSYMLYLTCTILVKKVKRQCHRGSCQRQARFHSSLCSVLSVAFDWLAGDSELR